MNAIVHNDWDIAAPLISIFSDRIEVLSHGGLPYGQTKDRFFMGISSPRNQQLMRIFTDLDIAEETGHGIPRIVRAYGEKAFEITDDFIQVTIPFAWVEETSCDDKVREKTPRYSAERIYSKIPEEKLEQEVLSLLERHPEYRAKDLSEEIGTSLRTIERTVAALRDEGAIRREGSRIKGRWIVQKELP